MILDTIPWMDWVTTVVLGVLGTLAAVGVNRLFRRDSLALSAEAVLSQSPHQRDRLHPAADDLEQDRDEHNPELNDVLGRLRASAARKEILLESEIKHTLRIREVYRLVALIALIVGLIPLAFGIWMLIFGGVTSGIVTAAIGLLSEVLALFSNRAARDAHDSAEARISELRASQDSATNFELALYAADTLSDPWIRDSLIREVVLNQVGVPPARLSVSDGGERLTGQDFGSVSQVESATKTPKSLPPGKEKSGG